MTLTSKALLAALLFAATLPTLHAANPRLLAYYGYWDRWNTPTYDASNIPYNQLTHIVHDSIGPASAADGTLSIPPGFLEPELISRAHAAGVKVEICISGNSALFVTIDADAQLRARSPRTSPTSPLPTVTMASTSTTKFPATLPRPANSPR